MSDMLHIELEFECSECHNSLSGTVEGTTVTIEPCETCTGKSWEEGYREAEEDKEETEAYTREPEEKGDEEDES